jgi:PST family polysaccharide transporter
MSKVPDIDRRRLRFAIEQGSILQMLALGVPFAGFAVASPWLVPALFGKEWTAAVPVFAVLALVAMLNAPSMILGTFLFSRGQNLRCCASALIGVVVLAVASVVLVRHLGVVGFGWASLIALVDTVYLDRMVRRITDVAYRSMAAYAAVLAPAILFPLFPRPYAFAALAPLGLLLVVPALRAETVRIVALVRGSLARSPA